LELANGLFFLQTENSTGPLPLFNNGDGWTIIPRYLGSAVAIIAQRGAAMGQGPTGLYIRGKSEDENSGDVEIRPCREAVSESDY
jgi:hypothetical protein